MKRVSIVLCLALCLAGFAYVWAFDRATTKLPPQQVEIIAGQGDDYAYSVLDENDVERFQVDVSGNVTLKDASGTVDSYIPSDRVVYITSYTQLSTWSGQAATAGQSYFQTEPGKIYIVDPHAIATSNNATGAGAPAGTTAAMAGNFSGVSAILPNASLYGGPAYDVTVMIATTGGTGYAVALTGSTTVQVWPYPGSGATSYNANATTVPQNLLGNATLTGGSAWVMGGINFGATFGLENSSVSAYVKQKMNH